MTSNNSTVSHITLRGHKDSVGCVEWSQSTSILASGSDDGSVRLWDIRAGKCIKAILAFQKQPVQLVSWASSQAPLPNSLWAASGRSIYCFDIRSDKMLIREPTLRMQNVCSEGDNDDEISSLHLQQKGGEHVAVADDAGLVHLLKVGRKRSVEEASDVSSTLTLERGPVLTAHSNIVTAAIFRPNTLRDLVSGSLDGSLIGWDISKPNQPIWTEQVPVPDTEDSAKLLNPPLVHSVAVHPSGRYFAAALGDSSVSLHAFGRKSHRPISRLTGGHATSVAQVHFPGFDHQLLLSAGNDMKISFWALGELFEQDHQQSKGKTKLKDQEPTGPLARLAHNQKMNWIASSTISSTIHIADVSSSISVFDVSRV